MKERYDLCYTCYTKGTRCTRDSAHAFKFPNSFAVTIKMPLTDLEKYVVEEIKKQMHQAPEADTDSDMIPSSRSTTTFGYECSKSKEFFDSIVSAIIGNADGRFLLALQYTKSLANQMTPRDVDKAIKEMKENRLDISETINKLYEQDMQWITEQESGKRKLAIRVLSWVSGTHRNLNLMELKHALATYVGDTTYNNKGEPALDTILSATKGLIQVGGDETVRLTHRTLKEYFDKRGSYWFERGQIEIAKTCLTYLSFDTFAKRCLPEEFSAKEDAHPFFSYAIEFWGDHVRKAGPEAEAAAVRYLQNPVQVEAYIQAAWMANTQDTDKWDCRRSISPLHICAWFDLMYLISALNYQTLPLDVQEGTYGQTPLMYACRRGHVETVARLLYLGASLNIVSGRGRTALTEAVLRGWKEIVNLLLNPDLVSQKLDVNVLYPKMFNRTPLMLAIRLGFTDISLAILKHPDVLINKQDSEGNTVLSLAAYLGMEQVVRQILLKADVDVDLRDYSGGYSALSWAAHGNHKKVVELLVGDGADPNLKDKRGGTAALRAVEEGSMEALKKLFDSSADLSCQDENGRTLLHAAAEKGYTDIISVLHEKGLGVNVPDRDGAIPLHSACRSGQYKAAELLLELGADFSIEDTFKRTPFIVAAQYGQTELQKLCREKGTNREADVGQNLQEENLPIWSLVRLRRLELIEAALVSRAEEVNIKEPGLNNTALHWAIIPNENDDKDPPKKHQILRRLLAAGNAYLNEPDNNGQSPLHMAAIHGDKEATKILLEGNANVDKEDKFGLTPLIIATENEAFDLAMILIEADASIDGSKVDVEKLLFAAISLQRNLAAMNLIRAGADPLAQDENGRTVVMMAEMMAKRSGDRALLSFLQSQPSMKYQVRRKTEMKSDTDVAEVELFGGVTPSEIAFRPFRSPHLDLEQGELLYA
jgi:ankyrin repeat protein